MAADQRRQHIGISAMMHGYMPFDKEGKLLVPFRTWRNNITGEASGKLMELFQYQYSTEMEYCTSVSGNPERRRACKRHRLICATLEAICALGS